ncbi:MAG: dTMP kinase [Nostocaceae cyanobacterium]|nr:dTMP kinase [Nostocaceae cyanobacterium]
MDGKLIVFEGVEGCGKTTQIQLCCQWLQTLNVPVVMTRQPGGTELGLHLRRLLLEGTQDKPIASRTELLLYAADRSQHVEQELKPNLAAGKLILCDRYTDSTIAYQGYGRGIDMNLIHQLNAIATGGLGSHLTLWLDVDVEVGLSRKQGDGFGFDRIEQEKIDFHRRVQQGYKEIATSHPQGVVRVDGNCSREVLQEQIREILSAKLKEWGVALVGGVGEDGGRIITS